MSSLSQSSSISLYSSISNKSLPDLPNLPGVRRDISSANPKLYREFKSSLQQKSLQLQGGRQQQQYQGLDTFTAAGTGTGTGTGTGNYHFPLQLGGSLDENDENLSLGQQSLLADVSKILTPFEASGSQFNDISGRYGLYSQKRDRLHKTLSLPYCSTGLSAELAFDICL